MILRVLEDPRAAARSVATRITAALAARPTLVLGLPTGRTAVWLYRELVAAYHRGQVDFARATTFNLDEFVGLAPGAPGSYRWFMEQHFFRHVNVAPDRTHFLNGAAPDLDAECQRYEAAIAQAGGIDLIVLGLGTNGHVGFNEPGRTLAAWTHRTTLRRSTRRANRGLFGGDVDRVPREGLSMGMATILQARAVVLLATGRSKARAVAGLVRGPLSTWLPASLLQLHRDVEVVVDQAAARRLSDEDSLGLRGH